MPVRVLYKEMKSVPVPLIADMYIETIVPSLDDSSLTAYQEMMAPLRYRQELTDTEEKSPFIEWRNVPADLYFTEGYKNYYKENPIFGLWVAYEALSMIFEKYPGPLFRASYMQVFTYKRKRFWVTAETGHIVFSTPNEY